MSDAPSSTGDLRHESLFPSRGSASQSAVTQAKLALSRLRGLRGSFPLMLANLLETIVTLVRNVALAHLIAPREFGLAISMTALIGIVDVMTDFGVPIYSVRQSVDLPEDVVMATVQSIAIIRAAVIAMILVAIAPMIAGVFDVAGDATAYALLGLVAFARGFENFGVKAMTRAFRFGREATVVVCAQIVGLITTLVTAAYLESFICILWGMVALTAVTLVLSHALSPRRYRLGWNQQAAKDIALFGFPLLANGAAVAFCLTDRILIGALLNPSSLATYNVTVGTAQSPRCIAVRFLTSAFVPAFVGSQQSAERSRELHDLWTWLISGIAFAYAFFLTSFGAKLIELVFGPSYAPSRELMALTSMYIFVSFLMHIPVPSSYAAGQTKTVTYGSTLYATAMVPAFATLLLTRSLSCFVSALAVSVLVSLFFLLREFRRKQPFFRPHFFGAVFVPFGMLALLAALTRASVSHHESTWLLACGGVLASVTLLYLAGFLGWRWPQRGYTKRLLRQAEAS